MAWPPTVKPRATSISGGSTPAVCGDEHQLGDEQRLGLRPLLWRQDVPGLSRKPFGVSQPSDCLGQARLRKSGVPAHECEAASPAKDIEGVDLVPGACRIAKPEERVDPPVARLKLHINGSELFCRVEHPPAELVELLAMSEPSHRQLAGVQAGCQSSRVTGRRGQREGTANLDIGLVESPSVVESDGQLSVEPGSDRHVACWLRLRASRHRRSTVGAVAGSGTPTIGQRGRTPEGPVGPPTWLARQPQAPRRHWTETRPREIASQPPPAGPGNVSGIRRRRRMESLHCPTSG